MKRLLSCLILAIAGFCISCGSDDPPPTQTVIRETQYVPVKPKKPSGPERFEPVNRY